MGVHIHQQIHEQVQSSSAITAAIVQHPYLFAIFSIAVICIGTRIKTGIEAKYISSSNTQGTPRNVPVAPYWIPFVGHSISFGIWYLDYLKSIAYTVPSGIYALKIGGGTHNVLISPSLVKEVYNKPNLPLTSDPIAWRFLDLAFGDNRYFETWEKNHPAEYESAAKVLHNLMKEPFLSNAVSNTIRGVEEGTWNLVSGNPSWVDHSRWERAGGVEVLPGTTKDGSFVAEANLFALLRDWAGDLATSVVMGRSFLENNPNYLEDMWLFDSKIFTLMLGIPWWLTPGVAPGIRARNRLTSAVTEHHKAMLAHMEGKDPGYKYSDVSDVSSLVWDRLNSFNTPNSGEKAYGVGDMLLVWALNINANPIVFWMIFFLHANPDLLQQVRDEVKPFIQLHQAESSGLPIQEAPKMKIDLQGLVTKCPLLKGTFYEAMRHEGSSTTYKVATDDFIITESKDDAAKVGKPHPDKYIIKKGDLVCLAPKIVQDSPRYFPNPETFNPRRFWVKSTDEKGEEHIDVEYGAMRPWGGGKSMCKGRNFAEREVYSFVAAILTVWDIEPVDVNKGWKHPGDVTTAGTFIPKNDIRVRLSRRKL